MVWRLSHVLRHKRRENKSSRMTKSDTKPVTKSKICLAISKTGDATQRTMTDVLNFSSQQSLWLQPSCSGYASEPKHGVTPLVDAGDEFLVVAAALGTKKERQTYVKELANVMVPPARSTILAITMRPGNHPTSKDCKELNSIKSLRVQETIALLVNI